MKPEPDREHVGLEVIRDAAPPLPDDRFSALAWSAAGFVAAFQVRNG
jgi:hypothetical protein